MPLTAPKRNAVNGKWSKKFRTVVEATAGFAFRMRMKVGDGPGTMSSASAFETPMAVQPRSRRGWFPFVSEITPEIQPVGRPRHICTLAFSEQSSSARRGKSGVVAQRPRFIAVWESFFTHVGVSSK